MDVIHIMSDQEDNNCKSNKRETDNSYKNQTYPEITEGACGGDLYRSLSPGNYKSLSPGNYKNKNANTD